MPLRLSSGVLVGLLLSSGCQRSTTPSSRTAIDSAGDPRTSAEGDDVRAAVTAWGRAHDGQPLRIELRETDPARGAHISCPIAVRCDEHADARAFVFEREGVWLRLSFGAALAREISLPLIEREFQVASVIYHPEALTHEGWDLRAGNDPVWRRGESDVRFTGWREGRVQGELRGVFTRIGGVRRDCAPADAPMPPACMAYATARVPFVITFDLPLPTGTLDCTADPRPATCGR